MSDNPIDRLRRLAESMVDINSSIPTEDFLSNISYKSSKFNKSLKQLRVSDISIEDVLYDLMEFQKKINDSKEIDDYVPYRVKTRQSLLLKYSKYLKTNGNFLTCFNDLLGFRVKVIEYPELGSFNDSFRVVDLTSGKKDDDGYRAVHLYYKKDNNHYPIEIQLWSENDWDFNNWAHIYAYKYLPSEYGCILRDLFSSGKIKSESDFRNCVEVLKNGKGL